jgi:hypothetical protein
LHLMQLNVRRSIRRYYLQNSARPEAAMLEFYEPGAAIIEDSIANAVRRVKNTNKCALDFMLGVQEAALEEMIFVGNEFLDRLRVETQLFGEFSSKMAGAHSVKNLKTMYDECSQHQIDFVRRDSERLFKHGERMIETASSLFNVRSKD